MLINLGCVSVLDKPVIMRNDSYQEYKLCVSVTFYVTNSIIIKVFTLVE